MTVLGAGLLWFGWFGFNAGSALTAGGLATTAFVNTQVAAAAGAVAWAVVEAMRMQKATMLGVASGLVAGLVAVTPAAGFVSPIGALAIGGIAGVACFGGVLLKNRFGYDDALDAFGVHGIGGAAGAVLTGVFATAALTGDAIGGGLIAGNARLVGIQLLGVLAAAAYAIVVTVVILKVVRATVGLRVDPEVEHEGLDGTLHGESGYALGSGGAGGGSLPESARQEPHAALVSAHGEA
jgi:Amt family ammonium transporter